MINNILPHLALFLVNLIYALNYSIAKDVKIGIEKALNSKLDELDPQGIKIIIENMIKKHLGWLIVWGGVFGGLFGLLFSLIQNII